MITIVKKIGMLILILICFSGCQDNENIETIEKQKDSKINEHIEIKESIIKIYITLTCTGYNNSKDATDGMTTKILFYDPTDNTTKEVFSYDSTAQYSLGHYDKNSNTVYYVKRVRNGDDYGDQIFMKDLNTNEETQLSNDLFAVNHIIPVQDKVFIVACRKNERADKLAFIDKKSKKIKFWEEQKDYCVRGITEDRMNNKIYISAYSMAERDESYRNQTPENYDMQAYTVYQVDFDFHEYKELFSRKWSIETLMFYKNKLVAFCDKEYFGDEPPEILEYDINTGVITMDVWTSERLSQSNPDYSSDGEKIYGVAVINGKRGLVEYDVRTKKMNLCVESMKDYFINNIYVVKTYQ